MKHGRTPANTASDKLFISNKVCLKGDHEMLLIVHK